MTERAKLYSTTTMRIVVVIPTFMERNNIGPLIRSLHRQSLLPPHEMGILVVDDNSPDGTAGVVRELQHVLPDVELLSGQKKGLGAAYVRGMAHALAKMGADAVFEMDADFSHDPADIPRMVRELEAGADFVIGSRYTAGGSTAPEWGSVRRMISRLGNIAARNIAGLYRIRDCTAGFRAIRAGVLNKIDLAGMRTQGYAFQVELLHRAVAQGAKVVEIPVHFADRKHGRSKLGLKDLIEFALNVWWIRLERSKTFLRFCVVGASGIAINLGAFTFLLSTGLNRYVASPLAVAVSILWNSFLNTRWTFGKAATPAAGSVIRARGLNTISLVSLAVSFASFVFLSILLPNVLPQFNQLIAIAPAIAVNYSLKTYWSYRIGSSDESSRTVQSREESD